MIDISKTTAPKSDQLNYDDIPNGAKRTVKITKVSIMGEADQPIAINYEGDNGKPYKPCKSMRRVLVNIWGSDGNQFIGRRMTLFGDPNVVFGGAKVGGIRISHLSNMKETVTMALTATRASRKPYTVQPLVETEQDLDHEKILSVARIEAKKGTETFKAWVDLRLENEKEILRKYQKELSFEAKQADLKSEDLPI